MQSGSVRPREESRSRTRRSGVRENAIPDMVTSATGRAKGFLHRLDAIAVNPLPFRSVAVATRVWQAQPGV